MSIAAMSSVWKRSRSKGSNLLVLLAIADFADDDGRGAYPSMRTIANKARLSESSTHAIVNRLVSSGELVRHMNAGPHGVNLYDVVLPDDEAPKKYTGKGGGVRNLDRVRNPEGSSLPDRGGTVDRTGGVRPAVPDPLSDPSEDPSVPLHHARASRSLSPDALAGLWNDLKSPRQPTCQAMSDARTRHARARLAEVRKHLDAKLGRPCERQDEVDFWSALIRRIASSAWHTGSNARGWIASFEFLTREATWVRYVEQTLGGGSRVAPVAATAEEQRRVVRNANVAHVAKGGMYTPTGDDDYE